MIRSTYAGRKQLTVSETALGLELDRRESVSSELTRKLVDHLVTDGRLKPGDRLPSERQLAAALGIGRSAVRDALRSLSLLGLIEIRQGSGSYVKEPDSELLPQIIEWGMLLGERNIMDLVEARSHIETAVAALAADRRTDGDLTEIKLHLDAMSRATNTASFVEADVAFHIALARAAGNAVFLDIITSVQSLLRVWITRVIDAAATTESFHREHFAVFEAVEAGDPDGARVFMQRHMDHAAKELAASLEDPDSTNESLDGSTK